MKNMDLRVQDALRYMQMPKSEYDEELIKKIESTYELLSQISTPKYVCHSFSISLEKEAVLFNHTKLKIMSSDLVKLFKNCSRCYIIAATLGQGIDRQINIKQKTDMLEAVVLDSCASVLIDTICDDIEKQIAAELGESEFLTMRFSPGYGDVSLEVQQQVLDVLDAGKRAGISVTKTHMLVPTKSITAFIGISKQKENRQKNCGACSLAKTCLYRERGDKCGL